jgi:ATP-binding cassette subfamily B protein
MQGIVYNLSFVVVLGSAIFFLRNGLITPGEFVMFFGYISLSFSPFFRLSEFYNFYKRASVAIKRIIKLKNILPESMKHGEKEIDDFKGNIQFKNLSFSYSKNKETLKNVNLKIKAGESVALVGESGVGKTTLSELVLGYYQPSKGNIFLDGINIAKLKLKWLRKSIAIVPQEISIFNDTLIKNLKYANPKASFEDIVKAAKAADAHKFIMLLPKKYKTLVGERGVKLSVGQKQRIAITMAFLKNPKILILDEPTSSLDAKSEKSVKEGIKQLIKDRTTLIIAHRFSTVRDADKIVVLDKGRIVEMGNHNELVRKKGKYYELYKLQRGLD